MSFKVCLRTDKYQSLYSLTNFKNVPSLFLLLFLNLEILESNIISDWLQFSQSEVVLLSNLQNLGERD